MFGELLSVGIQAGADLSSGAGEIVGRVPEFNVRTKQKPIGSGLAERHAHTAGI
jgi:hypothetical protein